MYLHRPRGSRGTGQPAATYWSIWYGRGAGRRCPGRVVESRGARPPPARPRHPARAGARPGPAGRRGLPGAGAPGARCPGHGHSTVAVELVAERVARGEAAADRCLLLAPTRLAAARLRDAVTSRLGGTTTTPLARTHQSLGFGVLREAAALAGDPAPRLLSGPEQDVVLGELLAGHAAGSHRRPRLAGRPAPRAADPHLPRRAARPADAGRRAGARSRRPRCSRPPPRSTGVGRRRERAARVRRGHGPLGARGVRPGVDPRRRGRLASRRTRRPSTACGPPSASSSSTTLRSSRRPHCACCRSSWGGGTSTSSSSATRTPRRRPSAAPTPGSSSPRGPTPRRCGSRRRTGAAPRSWGPPRASSATSGSWVGRRTATSSARPRGAGGGAPPAHRRPGGELRGRPPADRAPARRDAVVAHGRRRARGQPHRDAAPRAAQCRRARRLRNGGSARA